MDFQQTEMPLPAVSARMEERLLKLHKRSS